ncbi:MAG: sulfur carrier protein ThiS, partial [Candidatus Omnitrophica bacterium]|nr:sulfur carrier protein ThiS [Candidatus Omnitrophota bacterium]
MKVQVNGEAMELEEGIGITDLLNRLKLKPELVVVEHNLNILKRDQLPGVILKEADQVEIVHFVGGGALDVPPRSLSGHGSCRLRVLPPSVLGLRPAGAAAGPPSGVTRGRSLTPHSDPSPRQMPPGGPVREEPTRG